MITRRTALALPFSFSASLAQEPSPAGVYITKLEQALQKNIIPFWYPRCLDREHGGYIINMDSLGRIRPDGVKMIVTQSRTLWLAARLARAKYDPKAMLAAAEHGFRFLQDRMRDPRLGGYYWELDSTGKTRRNPLKHMYGMSFVLYALSEYALAAKNAAALQAANDLFQIFENKAYDREFGGYRETFREDWTPMGKGETGPMGPAEFKLMNTHLHLLESVTTYYRASKSPLARQRLEELVRIEADTVVRKHTGACTDKYQRDWTPVLGPQYARVSYGHDLENIWLLMDACNALGVSSWPLMDTFKTLFAYSMKYGFDYKNGGFFYTGNFDQAADDLQKSWWVQAEALVSALSMHRMTREPQYWNAFEKTWAFVDKYQIDWDNGEWHSTVSPELKGSGAKAGPWKAGYHNGRAMIECLALLRELAAEKKG